jgi:hypothetical protein
MSQLPDQLLKSSNIPVMVPIGQNMNMLTGVPIPQQLQPQANMTTNPMGMGVADHRPQQNPDTSN